MLRLAAKNLLKGHKITYTEAPCLLLSDLFLVIHNRRGIFLLQHVTMEEH